MFRSLLVPVVALIATMPGGGAGAGGAGRAQAAQALTAGTIVEPRGADGLFHVSARIGAARLRLLVDTGATALVLSERHAHDAGIPAGGAAGTLATAGGAVGVRWTRVARIEIAGIVLRDVEVAVVQGTLANPLAGQEVLARMGTVSFAGDRLTISPR